MTDGLLCQIQSKKSEKNRIEINGLIKNKDKQEVSPVILPE